MMLKSSNIIETQNVKITSIEIAMSRNFNFWSSTKQITNNLFINLLSFSHGHSFDGEFIEISFYKKLKKNYVEKFIN